MRAFADGRWTTVADADAPDDPAAPSGRREPWAEAHVSIARAFLAALAGRPTTGPELATFADGARVQAIVEAAARASDGGRRVDLTTS